MKSIKALPQLVLECGGNTLPRHQLMSLGKITVRQHLSLPSRCELEFHESAGSLAAADILTIGRQLQITLRGFSTPLFSGQITAVEYLYSANQERSLRVRAYDALHILHKRQAVQTHTKVTLADVARKFVSDLGLTVDAQQTGPLWPYLIESTRSHFDLLARMAEHCGLYFTVRGKTLHILALEGLGNPIALAWRDNLFELRAETNSELAVDRIVALGWDPTRVEFHTEQRAAPRIGRTSEAVVAASDLGGHEERLLLNRLAADYTHIEAIALSELDWREGNQVTLSGVAEGDCALQPGAVIDLQNVNSRLIGHHVLTKVKHTINNTLGYVSEFFTAPPEPSSHPRSSLMTYGEVTSIDDPERLGRIRAILPTFNHIETDWMGILSIGAGTNKGLMVLPDVGDKVLILLEDSVTSQGIVLGGLYGADGMPDDGITDGAVRRYTLRTPGGQMIQLNDTDDAIRFENSDGSFIELKPGQVRLHSATDLEIEAPGQAIVIRSNTIDFQRG